MSALLYYKYHSSGKFTSLPPHVVCPQERPNRECSVCPDPCQYSPLHTTLFLRRATRQKRGEVLFTLSRRSFRFSEQFQCRSRQQWSISEPKQKTVGVRSVFFCFRNIDQSCQQKQKYATLLFVISPPAEQLTTIIIPKLVFLALTFGTIN